MTYYYDNEAKVLIAVDEETDDVRVLEPLNFSEEAETKRGPKDRSKASHEKDEGPGLPRVWKSQSPQEGLFTCWREV
jgi:hypothetical protein